MSDKPVVTDARITYYDEHGKVTKVVDLDYEKFVAELLKEISEKYPSS